VSTRHEEQGPIVPGIEAPIQVYHLCYLSLYPTCLCLMAASQVELLHKDVMRENKLKITMEETHD